jgi:hypothetical protein
MCAIRELDHLIIFIIEDGKRFTLDAMFDGSSGLRNSSYPEMNFNTFLGLVDKVEDVELEDRLAKGIFSFCNARSAGTNKNTNSIFPILINRSINFITEIINI